LREVQSPDGRVWRVRRRWLPKRPWLPPEDAVERGRLQWWWGLDWMVFERIFYPAVMLLADIAWFVVSLPFAILGRLLLGQPWRIEAATIGRPRMTREVYAKGWRGSREAIDDLARRIASGLR
jgi:hypothetical protein